MQHRTWMARLVILPLLAAAWPAAAQRKPAPAEAAFRAAAARGDAAAAAALHSEDAIAPAVPGDSVLVLLNHVKPEMRVEWERASQEFLDAWRRLGETDPAYRGLANSVRLLAPTRPDADGSYTYVVLIDPHRPGTDYDARRTLVRVHPPEKVDEILRAWTATFARPPETYFVVERWPER